MYICYKELDKRFAVVHGKRANKKARVEATVLNSLTPISKADICQILPDISATTVEAKPGTMMKSGSIKHLGQGREYSIYQSISRGLWENNDDKTRPISYLLCGNLQKRQALDG